MKLFFVLALLFLFACAPQSSNLPITQSPNHPILVPSAAEGTQSPAPQVTRAPSPTSAKPAIQTPAWFNDVVLYEIFPRSFQDSDGDGIGDLKGITQKLDYLQDLGVGAIWLTPIFASPSYHGYDITDYYKINPEFGTEQDLIELVDAAHQRDIKIILDFVAGHTSKQHPFFQDAYGNPQSKYANWFRWLNDAHTSYEHFGSATDMPSLNQDNPETRQYLIDVAKYWMDKANIDGYRLDYALGVPHDFWQEFRAELKKENPDLLLLGEVWASGLKIAPYYDAQFDATFDFPVYFDLMGNHQKVGSSALLGDGSPASFESTVTALTRLYNPGAQSVQFLNNHDTVRVASQLEKDPARAKLAATLLLTLPSTPMVYYGEEIGMLGDKSDGDKTVREPMDWYASEIGAGMTNWYKPDDGFNQPNDGISVQEQQAKKDSLLEHYRALIALYKKYPTLRDGEFIPLKTPNNSQAVAYARHDENETFVTLLNFGAQPVTISLPLNLLPGEFNGFTDELTGAFVPPPTGSEHSVVIPPLTARLLRVKK